MSLDNIRQQIKDLMRQREEATLEKGLSAQENKDLRENSEYDYWVEKENKLTIKIGNLQKEIVRLTTESKPKVVKKTTKKVKTKPEIKIKDLPRNKWL
jgi:hypothetical protein